MRKSNYDKFPVTMINGNIMQGWSDIRSVLEGKIKESRILAVDCYTGVYEDELVGELTKISAQIILVPLSQTDYQRYIHHSRSELIGKIHQPLFHHEKSDMPAKNVVLLSAEALFRQLVRHR